jgi:hypothetical protein
VRAADRAQNLVDEAVKRGVIIRKSACEICGAMPVFKDGRSGIQAHHCDYNKPLEVMWLCQGCHHKWHKENKAIPLSTVLAPMKQIAGLRALGNGVVPLCAAKAFVTLARRAGLS